MYYYLFLGFIFVQTTKIGKILLTIQTFTISLL